MAMRKPTQPRAAIQALDERIGTLKLGNIAILRKGADGNVTFWETEELREYRRDSTFGIVLGWLLGAANTLVGAPLGVAPGVEAGAALGTEAAAQRDVGFPDQTLRQLGEQLHAGSSALVTLVDPDHSADRRGRAGEAGRHDHARPAAARNRRGADGRIVDCIRLQIADWQLNCNLQSAICNHQRVRVTFCKPRGWSGSKPLASVRCSASSCPGTIAASGLSHSGRPPASGSSVVASA